MSSLLEQQFRTKWAMWAALGAGCLLGMSGLALVQRLALRIEHTSTQSLSRELASINSTIKELQEEIKLIQKPPLKSALRSVTFSDVDLAMKEKNESNTMSSKTSTTSAEYLSAISSDDDEFYDLPTDTDEEGAITMNGSQLLVERALERLQTEIVQDPELNDFFRSIDYMMEGEASQQKKALELLRSRETSLAESADFLWRYCKSMYLTAVTVGQEGEVDEKQKYIFDAVDYGLRAIEKDDTSSEAHKWYAIVVGSRGEYLGIKEKIMDGYEFKKHIDRASELAPNDHTIRHLLGRFCYEVAELSWWERKMAAALFADPPTATMEEARDHFMAAEELKPDGWKENRQFLAKCHIQLKDYSTALFWLDRANELPVKNPDDQQAQDDINELLAQFDSYR